MKILHKVTSFFAGLFLAVLTSFVFFTPVKAAHCKETILPNHFFKVLSADDRLYTLNNAGELLYFPNKAVEKSWQPWAAPFVFISPQCFSALPTPKNYPAAMTFAPGSSLIQNVFNLDVYRIEPPRTLVLTAKVDAADVYDKNLPINVVNPVEWPNYLSPDSKTQNQLNTQTPINRANGTHYDTEKYMNALSTYRGSGYYFQLYTGKISPGNLSIKSGVPFMVDNYDFATHTLAFGDTVFQLAPYGYALISLENPGIQPILCDGGQVATILVAF